MSDGAAVPATVETAQQGEERQFQAASAATTLSRRLSKQQRKSASAASKSVQPAAQTKPRQSKNETGLMAMMEDILPSNCA